MERWRFVFLAGIFLGLCLEGIDYFVTEIPYLIYIPLQIAAIAMIFGGLIHRKRDRILKERTAEPEKQR